MAISYGEPKNRIEHFKRKFLKFDIQTIKICKKLEGADDISKKYYYDSLKELDGSSNYKKDLGNQNKE